MSDFTNQVHTPRGDVFVADDVHGDRVIEQLFEQYGNIKVTVRRKVFGQSLASGEVVLKTTLKGLYE